MLKQNFLCAATLLLGASLALSLPIRAQTTTSSTMVTTANTAPSAPNTTYASALYKLDKPHTQILFSVDHMGYTKSHGSFLNYDGSFRFDRAHPENSTVQVTIQTDSLELGDQVWNQHTKEYFHTDKFPTMIFKSTAVKVTGANTGDITGNLTLLGVTKPVVLHTTFNKADKSPFGGYAAGFTATTSLNRSDFGMKEGIPMVSDKVDILIEAQGNLAVEPGNAGVNH